MMRRNALIVLILLFVAVVGVEAQTNGNIKKLQTQNKARSV